MNPESNPDQVYRLTPKGWLLIQLMNTGITTDQFEKLWSDFALFVADQAAEDNTPDGVPALVFADKGGVCTMLQEKL